MYVDDLEILENLAKEFEARSYEAQRNAKWAIGRYVHSAIQHAEKADCYASAAAGVRRALEEMKVWRKRAATLSFPGEVTNDAEP